MSTAGSTSSGRSMNERWAPASSCSWAWATACLNARRSGRRATVTVVRRVRHVEQGALPVAYAEPEPGQGVGEGGGDAQGHNAGGAHAGSSTRTGDHRVVSHQGQAHGRSSMIDGWPKAEPKSSSPQAWQRRTQTEKGSPTVSIGVRST